MREIGEVATSAVPGEDVVRGTASTESQAIYEYIAFQINREDGLINYRLTWTLQLNGFLFAALALIGEANKVDAAIRNLLVQVLPVTGIATNLAGLAGVVAANMAIRELKELWGHRQDTRFPRPFGKPSAFLLGLLPSVLLPAVLVFVWVFALCRL
ncbi:MAG: hypothetical protein IT377_12200 [Polyangiaceae bacterium]|nr:hypothetical protein [Polyangiaceae bacterium]